MALTFAKAGSLYANNGRIMADARSRGFNNALSLDIDDYVAETASTNVFTVKDGEVFTPIPNGTFLNGLNRQRIIKLLKSDGIKVHELPMVIKDFEDGNEFELHGLAYKIGFVRSYAFLLELDADVLVEEFKDSLQLNTYKEDYKFLTPNTEAKKFLPMGAVLSLFISVIIYTGWYYSDRNNHVSHVSNQVLDNNKTNFSTKND